VPTVLKLATADDSFADCLARNKAGTAIIAMIRMIATTINNSNNENPLAGFMVSSLTLMLMLIWNLDAGQILP